MTLHPRWAWLLPVGWLVLLLPPRVSDFAHDLDGADLRSTATAAAFGTIAVIAILLITGAIALRRGDARVLIAALAILVFAPKLLLGQVWIEFAGPLCAAALLTVGRPSRAWSLIIAIALADALTYVLIWGMGGAYLPDEGMAYLVANAFFRNMNVGISLFAVTRLAQLIQEADHCRRILATTEVRVEQWRASGRLRLSVGAQLFAIRQRTRDMACDGASHDDLVELADIARRAAARARSVVDVRTTDVRTPLRATDPATITVPFLFAWWMLIGILICSVGTTFTSIAYFGGMSSNDWVMAVSSTILVIALQLYHGAPRSDAAEPRRWPLTLTVQLIAVTAPVAVPALDTQSALFMYAVGAGLTLLRPPWSWTLFVCAAVVASPAMTRPTDPILWPSVAYSISSLVIGAATIYALCNVPILTRELHRTQVDLARVAVSAERLRFARDIHDLLGFHLSAITLTCELADREVDRDCKQVHRHLATVGEHTEKALGHVRDIHTTSNLTLDDELRSAQSLLADAGVRITVGRHTAETLPPHVDRVLAVVVREAITNIIRHSLARTCTIVVRNRGNTVSLHVTNDGVVDGHHHDPGRTGNGLANLTARTRDVDGTFTTVAAGDTFEVTAAVPLRAS